MPGDEEVGIQEVAEQRLTNVEEKTLESEDYIHYLDLGDGFMGIIYVI